jgi:acyl-CoA thioester hydrolase
MTPAPSVPLPSFRFTLPIQVRYGDLDPQRHVNHAKYFTYMELARAKYAEELGLWKGKDFEELGMIVADASCSYREAIVYGQKVKVGVRTSRLGSKSMTMDYALLDESDGRVLATGRTIMVAYDYRAGESIPVPDEWRRTIAQFEGGSETR